MFSIVVYSIACNYQGMKMLQVRYYTVRRYNRWLDLRKSSKIAQKLKSSLLLDTKPTLLHYPYKWPTVLSQMIFCWPCQTTKVHCRVCGASEWHWYRAGGIDSAAPVLARLVFLKVKTEFHFCKKQVINKVLVWFLDLLGLLY